MKTCRIVEDGRIWYNHTEETEQRGKGEQMKKWTIAGCVLWIIGLAVFITGMNMTGNTKEWMTVAGSIAFLAGLGISGAVWMKTKRDAEEADEKKAADQ